MIIPYHACTNLEEEPCPACIEGLSEDMDGNKRICPSCMGYGGTLVKEVDNHG